MSSEVSLLVELYNPLYLFPIVAVVFTALMVYAFGFKSSAQPPTEVVDALNDKHHKNYKTTHELVKRRKTPQKSSSSKSEPKTQPNGHINSESSRPSEKKTPKKVVTEQTVVPTVPKSSGKRQKNKKTEENDVEIDDKDSGEWVELISKKERKNRKQKEEQLLIEAKDSKIEIKTSDKTKKTSKKIKAQKNEETIKEAISSSPTKTNKETAEVVVNHQNIDTNLTKKQNGVNSAEELVGDRDVPDIYGLAKEQRVPKKAQKQRNTKRNSESELNLRAEPPLESEPKSNLNLSDKLTAAIVANYEGNENKADIGSNKKKKEKNKKKAPQPPSQTNPEVNGKQVSISERNEENNASNELIVEKESNQDIPNVTDVKSSEEDEFKVVNKKRRARRE